MNTNMQPWADDIRRTIDIEFDRLREDARFLDWANIQQPWTFEDCLWVALRDNLRELPDCPDRPAWVERETFTTFREELTFVQASKPIHVPNLELCVSRRVMINFEESPAVEFDGPGISLDTLEGGLEDWFLDASPDNLEDLADALHTLAATIRSAS